jgi:hypothetical protein
LVASASVFRFSRSRLTPNCWRWGLAERATEASVRLKLTTPGGGCCFDGLAVSVSICRTSAISFVRSSPLNAGILSTLSARFSRTFLVA